MRRIAMILIILLGGGAIVYSVILNNAPTIYFPGKQIAPIAQSPGEERTEGGIPDNQPNYPVSRDLSDGPHASF